MNDRRGPALTRLIRWGARLWSVGSIVLILLFVIGEGIHPTNRTEAFGLFFFPFGICAGMILAWRREGLGGSITTGSLVVFYCVHYLTAGTLPKGWAWLVLSAPGFFFLLSWTRSRGGAPVPGGKTATST